MLQEGAGTAALDHLAGDSLGCAGLPLERKGLTPR